MKGVPRGRAAFLAFLVAGFVLLVMPAANAYIDPGSGSYVFQVLVGLVLGAGVALKVFWRRIWTFVRRPFARDRVPKQG